MLILASASPRRHELLLAAGIEHIVRAAGIDESRRLDEPVRQLVVRLAREKAFAVACQPDETVLSADTVVAVGEDILGKPSDLADAERMLRLISGRDHWVYTGICLRRGECVIEDLGITRVWFAELSEEEISGYVGSGEPLDKAGAYAIQGLASKFVVSLEGSYQNVVGLPVRLVYQHLKDLGGA